MHLYNIYNVIDRVQPPRFTYFLPFFQPVIPFPPSIRCKFSNLPFYFRRKPVISECLHNPYRSANPRATALLLSPPLLSRPDDSVSRLLQIDWSLFILQVAVHEPFVVIYTHICIYKCVEIFRESGIRDPFLFGFSVSSRSNEKSRIEFRHLRFHRILLRFRAVCH